MHASAAQSEPRLIEPPLRVLESFALGRTVEVLPAGGTASPKWLVWTAQGKFVLRVRPAEFADESSLQFDHEVLRRLGEAGIPVPAPVRTFGGRTWLRLEDRVYEVLTWVEGEPFDAADPEARLNLGRFLAEFHRVLGESVPAGKEGRLREDHPALLRPLLDALRPLTAAPGDQRRLDRVGEQLDLVQTRLDSGLYLSLPHCVIHGDLHPGNLRFRGARVAAVYDFDYLNLQARVRDLCDLITFFAAARPTPLDCGDIVTLTQPFVTSGDQAGQLLRGYQETARLTEAEWSALPLLMRSRWIQMRLRGSRKVPAEAKVHFVLGRFFQVIDWLDERADDFFTKLREQGRPCPAEKLTIRS